MVSEQKLNLILEEAAKIVEPVILEILSSYVVQKNRGVVKYQISTGGKRLRPALAIISCRALGGKIKDVLHPAAGLEILHNYTLIIDDIIDNSSLRRGKPTTWAEFGGSIANCVAIHYGAAVFQAANRSGEPLLISELFAEVIKFIADGEIFDILFEQAGREGEPYVLKNRYRIVTKKDYLKMVGKKTAALFETACQIGGICAQASQKEINHLKNYGFNLGIAFQISDDILDIFGEEKKFGKEIGKDIIERKLGNIVVCFALEKLNQNDKKKFLKILKKKELNKRVLKEAVDLIKKTGAQKRAEQLGESFITRAKKELLALPKNKWSNVLKEIADFTIKREK